MNDLATETADDFVLTQPTVISGATIHGLLISTGSSVSSIARVEVEIYHVFKLDSDVNRTSGEPTFSTDKVPTRVNSPSDVEIDAATRDSSKNTLSFVATQPFVIQLRPETDIEAGRFEGKVEHLATHKSTRCHSLDQVLDFIASVLAEVSNTEQL
jgi:hypothetical protein